MSSRTRVNEVDVPTDDERLEKLAEVSDELQLIADADCRSSKYARRWLGMLREAGYDV